jgi:hypothetical protein
MNQTIQSIEDIIEIQSNSKNKRKNKNLKNIIFRQFEKKKDKFIATNNFYMSEEVDDGKLEFNSFNTSNYFNKSNEKIIPYNENNVYLLVNNKNNNSLKKYIDLTVISNISFSLEDININKSDIIKRMVESDVIIDEKLLEDLYFNQDFSKKINLELPKKYNNQKIILEDINIDKIYLFKINLLELNRNFEEEYIINY